MIMKKLVCILLILCVLPAWAFALDLSEFNLFASILGAPELEMKNAKTSGKHTGFIQNDCYIYIDESNGKIDGIYIDGKGDEYLAYCCAAIHVFDPTGDTTKNHGQLLSMYLMAHTQAEHQTGQTGSGYFFFIEPSDNGFFFLIGES